MLHQIGLGHDKQLFKIHENTAVVVAHFKLCPYTRKNQEELQALTHVYNYVGASMVQLADPFVGTQLPLWHQAEYTPIILQSGESKFDAIS